MATNRGQRRTLAEVQTDPATPPPTADEQSPLARGNETVGTRRRIDVADPFPMLTTDVPGQLVELHGHISNVYETLLKLVERVESKCDRLQSTTRDKFAGFKPNS